MMKTRLIGPFFFAEKTINGDVCLLCKWYIAFLNWMNAKTFNNFNSSEITHPRILVHCHKRFEWTFWISMDRISKVSREVVLVLNYIMFKTLPFFTATLHCVLLWPTVQPEQNCLSGCLTLKLVVLSLYLFYKYSTKKLLSL